MRLMCKKDYFGRFNISNNPPIFISGEYYYVKSILSWYQVYRHDAERYTNSLDDLDDLYYIFYPAEFSEFFYSSQELRKLKINKLNNVDSI